MGRPAADGNQIEYQTKHRTEEKRAVRRFAFWETYRSAYGTKASPGGIALRQRESCCEGDIHRTEVLREEFGTAGHCAAETVLAKWKIKQINYRCQMSRDGIKYNKHKEMGRKTQKYAKTPK